MAVPQSSLSLAAAAELATKSVSGGKGLADALEVLLGHGPMPPLGNTTTARVIGKADQGTVLVGIQVLGVSHSADAALIFGNILLEESGALGLGNRGVKTVAASALDAVMAVT